MVPHIRKKNVSIAAMLVIALISVLVMFGVIIYLMTSAASVNYGGGMHFSGISVSISAIAIVLCVIAGGSLVYAIFAVSRVEKQLKSSVSVNSDGNRCGWYRKQKHIFLNHLQVLYGYLVLAKTEEAKEYINHVAESISDEEASAHFNSCPEIGDLITVKKTVAETLSLDIQVLRWDSLKSADLSITDTIRIMGDIIDILIENLRGYGSGEIYLSNYLNDKSCNIVFECAPKSITNTFEGINDRFTDSLKPAVQQIKELARRRGCELCDILSDKNYKIILTLPLLNIDK